MLRQKPANDRGGRASVLSIYNSTVRGILWQIVLLLAVGGLVYGATTNAIEHLRQARIASGFGFLSTTAGFDVNQQLVAFSAAESTYAQAFLVGLLNTLLIAAIGVVLATILGFVIGIGRLSHNRLIATITRTYVEVVRNVPILLQLFIWYNAVLKPLPGPRQSLRLGEMVFLNNRGLFMPSPIFAAGTGIFLVVSLAGIVAAIGYAVWARRLQRATGRQSPVARVSAVLLLGLPLAGFFAAGSPVSLEYPELQGFNVAGGLRVFPEFVALLVGLVIYTAAFIAEIVRSGILAVSKGQTEAARSLGLHQGLTLRLIVIPQAMRVIIPPLTNQYLNLTKNSSLAVAIGYPDLVQVFMGTVLNQTGQAMEVIAITMAVYLVISLLTSLVMNLYNRRVAAY